LTKALPPHVLHVCSEATGGQTDSPRRVLPFAECSANQLFDTDVLFFIAAASNTFGSADLRSGSAPRSIRAARANASNRCSHAALRFRRVKSVEPLTIQVRSPSQRLFLQFQLERLPVQAPPPAYLFETRFPLRFLTGHQKFKVEAIASPPRLRIPKIAGRFQHCSRFQPSLSFAQWRILRQTPLAVARPSRKSVGSSRLVKSLDMTSFTDPV
jgi:hypothetical protein